MSAITQSTSHSTSHSSLLQQSDAGSTSPSSRSPSRSARRSYTAPLSESSNGSAHSKPRTPKRIIVLCDGTWEDGVRTEQRSSYTNVLRLARAIHHEDTRDSDATPIPQVVFYQSGIGSGNNLYSEYVEGTTGCTLPDKVEDAYAFIAHNFNPGDDIYLFGFSRGAYTARMIATFIGAIGILKRKDMDQFAKIFLNFKNLGISEDKKVIAAIQEDLKKWRDPESDGHKRAAFGKDKFTIKCLGVWDTVGSLGLPEEIPHLPKAREKLFGFNDCYLGEHVEHAYQALAINELRKDFTCNKFLQTPAGKAKGQTLKQTWFSGCHADIGGGYPDHDLSDLTLIWMTANVEEMIHIDEEYLINAIKPVAPWGEQLPHDSRKGIFLFTFESQRPLPNALSPETNEFIHPSVLKQMSNSVLRKLDKSIEAHPDLLAELMPLEQMFRDKYWKLRHEQTLAYEDRRKQKASAPAPAVVVSQVNTVVASAVVTETAVASAVTATTTTQIQTKTSDAGQVTSTTVRKTQAKVRAKANPQGATLMTPDTKSSSWFSSFVRSVSGNSLTPRSKSRKNLNINAQAAMAAETEGLDSGVLPDGDDGRGTSRRDFTSVIVCGR